MCFEHYIYNSIDWLHLGSAEQKQRQESSMHWWMLLLERNSSLWAILFPFFIQRLLISNWLLWDEPGPFFPHRSTLKKRFKEHWHDIWAWGWIFLWKHPCPWQRQQQHDAGWWQPAWEAGSLWHLLLREFSRGSLTFYFAACSAPSSLRQKPSDQLVYWSCSTSQSRDSPSDKQMDICCSQWGGGRQGTDGCGTVDIKGRLVGRRPEKWGRHTERFSPGCCILFGKAKGKIGKNWCNFSPFVIKPPSES